MDGEILSLIEVVLSFCIVVGFCLYELRSLAAYDKPARGKDRDQEHRDGI